MNATIIQAVALECSTTPVNNHNLLLDASSVFLVCRLKYLL